MSPPYRSRSCCVAFLAWLGFIRLGFLADEGLVPKPPAKRADDVMMRRWLVYVQCALLAPVLRCRGNAKERAEKI
jgi:hypothetical protein